MVLNKAIIDFINHSDKFDDDVKTVIIETLKLEVKQSGPIRYFDDYDKILTKIVRD